MWSRVLTCTQYLQRFRDSVAVQGNLDPGLLLGGGALLDEAVEKVVSGLPSGRHIFNLGHGILPQTLRSRWSGLFVMFVYLMGKILDLRVG